MCASSTTASKKTPLNVRASAMAIRANSLPPHQTPTVAMASNHLPMAVLNRLLPRPLLRVLQGLRVPAVQEARRRTMQPNMHSTMEGRTLMPRMEGIKIMWLTINTISSSKPSSRDKAHPVGLLGQAKKHRRRPHLVARLPLMEDTIL